MKKILIWTTLFLLTLVYIFTRVPVKVSAAIVYDTASDDSIATAIEMDLEDTASGSITESDDLDYYKFTLPRDIIVLGFMILMEKKYGVRNGMNGQKRLDIAEILITCILKRDFIICKLMDIAIRIIINPPVNMNVKFHFFHQGSTIMRMIIRLLLQIK